jgi:hypothetical protein
LLQIPAATESPGGHELLLESISLRDGTVVVTGRTARAK